MPVIRMIGQNNIRNVGAHIRFEKYFIGCQSNFSKDRAKQQYNGFERSMSKTFSHPGKNILGGNTNRVQINYIAAI